MQAKLKVTDFHFIPGLTDSFNQPHLCMMVHVPDDFVMDRELIQKLWDKLASNKSIAKFPDLNTSLGDQFAAIFTAFLKANNMPIYSEYTNEKVSKGVYRLRIPVNYNSQTEVTAVCSLLIGIFASHFAKTHITNDLKKLMMYLEMISKSSVLSTNDFEFISTAEKKGIPWCRFTSTLYQYGQGSKSRCLETTLTDSTPAIAVNIVQNKANTTRILQKLAIPAPTNIVVNNIQQAKAAAEKLGFPVVVKPLDSNKGKGVSSWIFNNKILNAAFDTAKQISSKVVVEDFIPGNDYRLHVLNGKCYRIRERIPGGVTGNGKSSIKDLLDILNADPNRGADSSGNSLVRIEVDQEALYMLNQQNLSLEDIPEDGRFVQLRTIANVSRGGVSIEIPIEDVHPDNLFMAERAVRAFNLDIAAVDFLCPDIRQSWLDTGGGICEINAAPQFGEGAAEKILEEILKGNGRIPVGVIFPDATKNINIEKLQNELASKSITLGAYLGSELRIGNHIAARNLENKSFEGGTILIKDREVDCIILEADDSFQNNGLPSMPLDFLIADQHCLGSDSISMLKNLAAVTNNIFVVDSEEIANKIQLELGNKTTRTITENSLVDFFSDY